MTQPPSYGDLGKSSKDLFSRHYHFGIVKLDLKSRTPTGVEFTVNGSSNNETGRVASALETKYQIKPYGVTLKQRWDTDNILTQEVTAEDYLVRGTKAGVTATFAPQSGKRTAKLTCGYKSLFLNLNSGIDYDYTGPSFNGTGVFGYLGWVAGMKVSFDPAKSKLSKTNFALGYQASDFTVTGHLEEGQDFNCSIYQKLNHNLEGAVNVAWSSNANDTRFGLGCHYRIDKDSAIRGKISSNSQIGVAFVHTLRPGIQLTLSTLIDAKNYSQGGHKLGLGIDLQT